MIIKMRKIVIILVLFTCAVHSNIFAGEISGARFLLVPPGSRPNAMGEAFTGIADDCNAVYWNAAGIAKLSKKEVSFTHTKGLVGTNIEYLTFVHPFKQVKGTLGLSVAYMSDSQWRLNEQGDFEGEFENTALTTILSYGSSIINLFDIGVNIKILRWELDNEVASGFAVDLGLLYSDIVPSLNIGIAVQNVGPKMRFIEDEFSLPVMLNVGFGYRMCGGKGNLALDIINYAIDGKTALNMGGEYIIKEMFAVRMGYKYHPDDVKSKSIAGLSAGFGFGVDGYSMDYSFVPYGELGNMHKISFIIKL